MNDDLISRKAVFELIDSKGVNGALMCGEKLMIDAYGLMDEVSDLPTAYDVDKVVEQLIDNSRIMTDSPEAFAESVRCCENPKAEYVHNVVKLYEAIDIVKAGRKDEQKNLS